MTEGVCHPAATLARKFESLAGLLAFILKQAGAKGLKAVLSYRPYPTDPLMFAINFRKRTFRCRDRVVTKLLAKFSATPPGNERKF